MKKLLLISLLLLTNLFGAPREGDQEIAFELPSLYTPQTTLASSSLRGKVVLLNLWASWCSGCQEEMPLFVKLQKAYPKKQFEIVLASIDADPQNARNFLANVDKDKHLTSLYDKDKSLPKAYRCPGMPSSFLIDKNGKIIDVYIGSLDDESLEKLKIKITQLIGK